MLRHAGESPQLSGKTWIRHSGRREATIRIA